MPAHALLRRDRFHAGLAALATFAILAAYSRLHATSFDNFVWEADGWLKGYVYLPHFPGDYIDAIPYHGRAYVYEAPLPAVLMVPFVALLGLDANQTLVAILLASLGIGAAWLVARRVGVPVPSTVVLVAFLLLGTSDGFCAASGDVWFIAHSGSLAFTLLALAELLGARRAGVVTFWALCAAFCRYPMFLALPAYVAWCWPQLRRSPRAAAAAIGVACAFAIPSAWFNLARYGTLADVGFAKFYRTMDVGRTDPSPPFALKNLAMQLQFYFTVPPQRIEAAPYLVAGFFGTALTFTSPALVVALFAPLRLAAVRLLWFAAASCALPALLYYSTGMVQLGARHALDFIPFLYALMAFALAQRFRWWYAPLFAWSIVFGAANLWVWMYHPELVPHQLR